MNKVILLAPLPPPAGGIAIWTDRMLKINNDRWQFEVVDEKLFGNREVFGNKTKRSFIVEIRRCFKIWKNLSIKLKDDVKIVHSCIPAGIYSMMREYICAIITKLHKKKFIVHFRCTVPNMVKSFFPKFVLKRLCNISDEIFVLNNESKKYIEKFTRKKVVLIPNFVESNEIIEKRVVNANLKRLLYVGGVVKEKGCMYIIDLAKKYADIEFVLIGNYSDDISNYCKDVKNVKLVGEKPKCEIKNYLLTSDAFLFLSYYAGEGFSNSLLEAMAMGLPCIVSDWAANKDMIEDKGGIVVSKEVDDLINSIELIKSKEIRKKMSDFNVQKVKSLYSDKVVIEQYISEYENMI